MLNIKDIEKFKEQLLTFKGVLEETGLAPASPILMTFASILLIKHSQRLQWLTIGLFVLTGVLAVLAGLDIWLRFNS